MAKQKKFKYRNQEYEIVEGCLCPICDICEEVNAKYLKGNSSKCVATTRTGKDKFDCTEKCGDTGYPKRIK